MKKILFYAHQLNYRGVTNSLVDYAEFNQSVLGNESTIVYNTAFNAPGLDILTDDSVVKKLKTRFNIIPYDAGPEDDFRELDTMASKYDLFYFQKAGLQEEPEIKSTQTANHAVFQYNDPHGDRYAYISEWLSVFCSNGKIPYVPYVVDLPPPNYDLRKQLGIHKNKTVFGRHGGFYTFDIDFVWKNIVRITQTRDDIIFLLANTKRSYEHPNVIYLPPFFGNQEKSNFINACDAMIHGRILGESFGNSICEFLFHNKPVLAWEGGYDRNHILLLQKYGLLYNDGNILDKIYNIKSVIDKDYKSAVKEFSAELVMKKFDEVFIK